MAKGQFNITQFALSDDGVNYNLFDTTLGEDADADILGLPVLEANTNDNAALRNLLITMDEGTQIVTFLTTNPSSITISPDNPIASVFVKTNNSGGVTEEYEAIEINNQTLWSNNILLRNESSSNGGKNVVITYKNTASMNSDATFTFKLQGKSTGVQSDSITLTAYAHTIPSDNFSV